jgi:hypothetical protein
MARKRKPVYQGWAWGLLNTKAHYYASDVGKFLCGVDMDWVLHEELLDDEDDHPENCLRCLRSLAKRRPLRRMQEGRIVVPARELPPELEMALFGRVSSRRKAPVN